jgi:hypothetical protein
LTDSSAAVFGCGGAVRGENPLAFDVAEVVDSFVGGLPDQPKQCALLARETGRGAVGLRRGNAHDQGLERDGSLGEGVENLGRVLVV